MPPEEDSMLVPRLFAPAALAAVVLAPTPTYAAWPTDPAVNVPVSAVATRSANPQVATRDSCGGIIVAWEDVDLNASVTRIYAQRVDAFGQPRWALNGIPVTPPLNMQALFVRIASDDAGGAFIAWSDQQIAVNARDVYLEHVLASGIVDPAWPVAGLDLC